MAFCDYFICSCCKSSKAFYDANIDWDCQPTPSENVKALCRACAKTHTLEVVTGIGSGAGLIVLCPETVQALEYCIASLECATVDPCVKDKKERTELQAGIDKERAHAATLRRLLEQSK